MKIIKDEDILPHIPEYEVILIGTNTYCTLGNGVQRDIALNYPYADVDNKKTRYGDISKLGTILDSSRENEPTICLLYLVKGYVKRKDPNEDWLDYEALKHCLKLINIRYKGKKIACPLLGCSRFDGNGNREKVLSMIDEILTDCDITVYDYFQKSRDEKQIETRKRERALIATEGYDVYHDTVKKRKALAEERFKRNGHARY